MENFEDGMESDFSIKIIGLLKENTPVSRQQVEIIILKGKPEDASEALRWLGRIECPNAIYFCQRMLEVGIKSPYARVRDGAVLGLTSMGGHFALATIEQAIKRETCPELREDMQQAVQSLKEQIILGS